MKSRFVAREDADKCDAGSDAPACDAEILNLMRSLAASHHCVIAASNIANTRVQWWFFQQRLQLPAAICQPSALGGDCSNHGGDNAANADVVDGDDDDDDDDHEE